jgi:hypothetical protein
LEVSLGGVLVGTVIALLGPSTPRFPKATEVKQFDFRLSPQGDFNQPEGWVRYRGPGYPFYITAELTKEEFAVGGRSLRFQLNGGNCAYFSPVIDVSADFNYVLVGQIKTKGLSLDEALLMIEFLDQAGKIVGTTPTSQRVRGDSDWTVVRVGPLPAPAEAKTCRIACVTKAGDVPDLAGKVYFDDLWLGRLPRLEVETTGRYRLFDVGSDKRAKVIVRGDEGRDLRAKFYLFDADRKLLAEESLPVSRSPSESFAEWVIPAKDAGFYYLDVALEEGGRPVLRRQFPITVLPRQQGTARGEFGVSLPISDRGLELYEHLLEYSGCRWSKLPLWGPKIPVRSPAEERGLAEFLERLSRRGYLVVGRLDGPPVELADQLAENETSIADLVAMSPNVWGSSLESLLVRYSLKIVHWQLGDDHDRGFQLVGEVDRYLTAVQTEASRIGRDIRLGVSWDYLARPPSSKSLAFLSVGDQVDADRPIRGAAPLSDEQIVEQIPLIKDVLRLAGESAELFVSITPLPEERYDRRSRIIDLARRAVAAKTAGASAIFLTGNGSQSLGMIDEDGAPNELFTIWRHLADNLGGMTYLGSLNDLVGVSNHLFVGGGRATLIAWSDEPSTVEAVLGRTAVVRDLWGRTIQPASDSETRTIQVDDMPIVVTDVDEFLIRWQFGVRFAKGSVPGRFGAHEEQIVVTNPLDVPVSGSAAPVFPPEWNQRPEQIALNVLPKETARETILISLPQGVSQGDYSIPIDFRLSADRSYRFRVFRPFRVGGDELRIEAKGRVLPSGSYEVDATVSNLTDKPMSLSASARTLSRPAELEFIPNLPAGSTTGVRFLFRDGADLSGQKLHIKFEDPRNRREFSYDHLIE